MRCTVSLATLAAASKEVPAAHRVARPLKMCPSRISWILCMASSAREESGKEAAARRMAWATLASCPAAKGDPGEDLSAAPMTSVQLCLCFNLHCCCDWLTALAFNTHIGVVDVADFVARYNLWQINTKQQVVTSVASTKCAAQQWCPTCDTELKWCTRIYMKTTGCGHMHLAKSQS